MGWFRSEPTLNAEIACWKQGHRLVAGLDEAGRGPLAGPVVAAAVILDPEFGEAWWSDLRDSKLLSAPRREELAARVRETACWGVGVAGHDEIDTVGLIVATRLAMERALASLSCRPDHLLLDAILLPAVDLPQRSIIHGDALSTTIAAASVVAKVARDVLMDQYHDCYPLYGFDHNRGYYTPEHIQALVDHGPCHIHRRSFAPVRLAEAGELTPAAARVLAAALPAD